MKKLLFLLPLFALALAGCDSTTSEENPSTDDNYSSGSFELTKSNITALSTADSTEVLTQDYQMFEGDDTYMATVEFGVGCFLYSSYDEFGIGDGSYMKVTLAEGFYVSTIWIDYYSYDNMTIYEDDGTSLESADIVTNASEDAEATNGNVWLGYPVSEPQTIYVANNSEYNQGIYTFKVYFSAVSA